jgi:hypothetical protein
MSTKWYNHLLQAYGRHRTRLNHALLFFLAGALYFYVVIPVFKLHIPCLFHTVTGLYLPGCGMTRCILAMIALDFEQAFRYNLLPFVLLPFALLYGWALWQNHATRSARWVTMMLVITLLYGVLRNIDTFAWLSPTVI